MRFKGLLIAVLILLAGCGSKEGITTDDLSLVKLDDEKAKVYYGMPREEVEKILGDPDESTKLYTVYESGVQVLYRDNKVVKLSIGEDAADQFKTAGGAGIGSTKEQLTEIYGDKFIKPNGEQNLDYLYDPENNEYVESFEKVDRNLLERCYLVSMMFDNDNKVDAITLSDYKAAVMMR